MKTRYLRVTMPDGSEWDVPADMIEQSYYSYYDDEPQHQLVKRDLVDWAENNMNWSDVEKNAKLISHPTPDFQEGWVNGKKEVIEK